MPSLLVPVDRVLPILSSDFVVDGWGLRGWRKLGREVDLALFVDEPCESLSTPQRFS